MDWFLIQAGQLTPAGNMALDQAVLRRSVEEGRPEPVVRIYGWSPPALSVGANVDLPEGVGERCQAAGVAVVRRATGGGCVLHDGDVTYSVVAPEDGRSVLDAYQWVAKGLIAGLRILGLDAAVARHPTLERHLDCFQFATGADLEVGGRKICGSAQLRRRGWFLQHGSIPLSDIRVKTAGLLGGSVDQRSTCLERARPGTTWNEVDDALAGGFAAAWGAEPCRRPPEPLEWGEAGDSEHPWGARLRDPLGMV